MDSKVVSLAIKTEIWPALKQAGFQLLSTRTAWREHSDRVDVVNLHSFNSFRVPAPHITTFSFCVFAGCYLKYIPGDEGVLDSRSGAFKPEPHACHARTSLKRGYMDFMESPTVWRIDTEAKKLPKAIEDARRVILEKGQRWLAQFASPRAVYKLLRSDSKAAHEPFYPMTSGSPHHCYLLGYAALAAGLHGEAQSNLRRAADSGCFKFREERLRLDVTRAAQGPSG